MQHRPATSELALLARSALNKPSSGKWDVQTQFGCLGHGKKVVHPGEGFSDLHSPPRTLAGSLSRHSGRSAADRTLLASSHVSPDSVGPRGPAVRAGDAPTLIHRGGQSDRCRSAGGTGGHALFAQTGGPRRVALGGRGGTPLRLGNQPASRSTRDRCLGSSDPLV